MSKVKNVTMEHRSFIKDNLDKAKVVCIEKKNMQPLIDEIRLSCDYLEKNVENHGLYEYAQKAIFGLDASFPEEMIIASNIYEEVHNLGSLDIFLD
jgi:hypothetical protein